MTALDTERAKACDSYKLGQVLPCYVSEEYEQDLTRTT